MIARQRSMNRNVLATPFCLLMALALTALAGHATAARAEDNPGEGAPEPPQGPSFPTSQGPNVWTFRTDTAPELDWYQPCDGGDNEIDFVINVHDVDLSTVRIAILTLAVWDVDFNCGNACGGQCERDPVYLNGQWLWFPVPYLTGANNQWSTVSFIVFPQWIVDGDNSISILIDTLTGSCWCVECDWGQLTLFAGATPEMDDIEIAPDNPTTLQDVTFTAVLKNMDGYEVVSIAWSGDVPAGNGNPSYTAQPASGTHGKDKNITATLTYRNTSTGATGTHSKSKMFNLFFKKTGDEDNDGVPNWFGYWNQLDVGDRHGITDVRYDAGLAGADGQYSWATTHVTIGPGAAGVDEKPPGTRIVGIDNFAQTLTHECYHYYEWNTWWRNQSPTDTDGDLLPDWYEDVGDDGIPNTGDPHELDGIFNGGETYDVTQARTAGNPWSGAYADIEWVTHLATDNNRGPHDEDWANPGKQTDPPEPMFWAGREPNDPADPEERERIWIPPLSPPGLFNDTYVDYGADLDGDGLYDYLVVEVGLDVVDEGSYTVAGGLRDSSGNLTWAASTELLAPGEQVMTLSFDGAQIRSRRVAGPYELVLLNLYDEGSILLDYEELAYTTAPYSHTDFDNAGSEVVAAIGESLLDGNGDGLADFLEITFEVDCSSLGEVTLEGFLFTANGKLIAHARNAQSPGVGLHTFSLTIDGKAIRRTRADGPYLLRSLALFEGEQRTDFIYAPYQTQAYAYTDFEGGGAEFAPISTFADYGVDLDGDGLFDLLRLEATIDVSQAGPYALVGRLFDGEHDWIADATVETDASAGQQTFPLDFPGAPISQHGAPGPYLLRYAFLYDGNGSVADCLPETYVTSPYSAADFQRPLVQVTGNYDDYASDVDGDGIYDYLTLDVEVIVVNAGSYAMNARLMDESGNEIVWASTTESIPADQTHMLRLDFDAEAIYDHQVDGPYYVRDLYLYNVANPGQSVYIYDAHTTGPYSYWQFGGLPPLPLDIKPGSCPNAFNAQSHGVLPVAVMSTENVDVTEVDISTLLISRADGVGGMVAPHEGPPGPHTVLEDVATPFDGQPCDCHELEGDGILDVSMKFKVDDLVEGLDLDNLPGGSMVELVVTGNLVDGTPFIASDCIRTVPENGMQSFNLSVSSNIPDVYVEVSPLDSHQDGPGFCNFARSYVAGSLVALTAPASVEGRPFLAWNVDAVLQNLGQTTIELPQGSLTGAHAVYGRGIGPLLRPVPAAGPVQP